MLPLDGVEVQAGVEEQATACVEGAADEAGTSQVGTEARTELGVN